MTTKTPKAVKATLSFGADFQVSFQTAEAKWMQLANGQLDPNEKCEDETETYECGALRALANLRRANGGMVNALSSPRCVYG